MTLALAHSHPAPGFNGLFYATVATIIPVLFLAIAVQGSVYQGLLTASARAVDRGELLFRQQIQDYGWGRVSARTVIRMFAPWAVAAFILVFGVLGEIEALFALYWQRPVGPVGVLVSALFLIAAVAAAPALAFGRLMLAMMRTIVVRIVSIDSPPGEPPAAGPPADGQDPEPGTAQAEPGAS